MTNEEEMAMSMPIPTNSPRKTMNLFYIIDVSGSMYGEKIEAVNQVMPEVLKLVGEISDENGDNAQIKASCLMFSDDAQWMYDEPVDASEFKWIDQSTYGGTEVGNMCRVLEKELHRNTSLGSETGHMRPAIIIMSDGYPTDNWKSGYNELKKNKWFSEAIKVAVGIGHDADDNMLKEFIGGPERYITVHNIDALKKMLIVVSTTVSKVGSVSSARPGEQGKPATDVETTIAEDIEKKANEVGGVGTSDNPFTGEDEWD